MPSFLRRTRVQLTLVYLMLIFAVVGPLAAAFWTANQSFEYGVVDASLRSQLDFVRSDLGRDVPGQAIPALPPGNSHGVPIAAWVLRTDGSVLAATPAGLNDSAIASFIPAAGFPSHSIYVTGRLGPDDVRLLVRRVVLPDGSSGGVILARAIAELETRLNRVAALLAGGVIALLAIGSLLSWWLAGRVLAPVRAISHRAREISEKDLHLRLHLDLPPGDELAELGSTLDSMLGRLEASFSTLQRFTADAAHELRAPLGLMRTQIEMALREPGTPPANRRAFEALLEETDRLTRMAGQLLLLARADAGELHPDRHPIDLPDLLEETVDRWRPVARQQEVLLRARIPAHGSIAADSDLVKRLFDNLLDNALRHTPARGSVTLSAVARDGRWIFRVADTGPGIDEALRPRLFERFARGDSARGRQTGGSGLGLSLCAAIVAAHGGTLELDRHGGAGGATFVVVLPSTN